MLQKTALFRSSYFFSSMHQKVLDSLSIAMKETTYHFRDVIIDFGKEVKNVYFIKEGEIKIQRPKDEFMAEEENLMNFVAQTSNSRLKFQP